MTRDPNKVVAEIRDAIEVRDAITRERIPHKIRELLDAGWSEARIVRETGLARNTVRRHNPELA